MPPLHLADVILAGHNRLSFVSGDLAGIFRLVVKFPHAGFDVLGTDSGVSRIIPMLAKRAAALAIVLSVEILHRHGFIPLNQKCC